MLLAGIAGFFVGLSSLRVRHDFLAITTMGVGFLFIGLVRQQDALGGEMGISGIPDPGLGKIGFLLLVLGCAAMVILLCQTADKMDSTTAQSVSLGYTAS